MATGSVIQDAINRIRKLSVEPSVNSEWTDIEILDDILSPAIENTYEDLSLSMDNPVEVGFSLPLVTDQRYYTLPPSVRRISRLIKVDSNNIITSDFVPRSTYNPIGPGWRINGSELEIFPAPSSSSTWTLIYTPTSEPSPHIACSSTVTLTTVVLAATPTVGALDRRANAYAGQLIRFIDDTLTTVDERLISAYDSSTRTATFYVPLTATPTIPPTGLKYEIVSPLGASLMSTATDLAVLHMHAAKGAQQSLYVMARDRYLMSRKSLRNTLSNLEGRIGSHYASDTIDNQNVRTLIFPIV